MARFVTEAELTEALAVSSHETYRVQKTKDCKRDGLDLPHIGPHPTAHDRERARNAVRTMKKRGIRFPIKIG